ncbi:MAG TPA: RNA polymerase subunit sigma-54, partial [Deltaproteobacteria bacterium]|nr:RNA polymerase subunit sigma-54 [Deltaproteobacteria bacterium]
LHPVKVDVRIIVATNKNLFEEMKEGRFREDLYYRLNVVSIVIPPLRERKEDIPPLMEFFLKRFNDKYKRNVKGFTKEARDMLLKHDYPGNVRELENIIERAIVLSREEYITKADIPTFSDSEKNLPSMEGGMDNVVEAIEKRMIIEALTNNGWIQTKAASQLGISERMLRYKMKKYNITKA